MLLLMLSLLMIQLKSFQRMLMVLSVVPLGLIGVVARDCWRRGARSALSPSSASWR